MLNWRTCLIATAFAAGMAAAGSRAGAEELSIYQIQYTTDPAGDSPYALQVVDCRGGIVTHKFGGYRPKLTLQDPDFPDGWGGIQVKDWTAELELFNNVSVGDWVCLVNVRVEEHRGNTLLQFKSDTHSAVTVTNPGSPLPPHRLVTADEIAAPLEGPPDEWYVVDHSAEKYEAMLLTVEDVVVTEMDLGKACDNYNLRSACGDCWAADYMNADSQGVYHPWVSLGRGFESVSGILEQYVKNQFDYYQLVTTCTADLVPVPAPPALLIVLVGSAGVLSRRRG